MQLCKDDVLFEKILSAELQIAFHINIEKLLNLKKGICFNELRAYFSIYSLLDIGFLSFLLGHIPWGKREGDGGRSGLLPWWLFWLGVRDAAPIAYHIVEVFLHILY